MLAGEYTLSPDETTRRTEPTPYVPPPPETRNPPLCVLSAVVVMLEMLNVLLVVNVFCFAPTAADISVIMSAPPKYRGPVMRAELPQIKEPDTSKDGAVTGAENTALLAEIPSRSTLLLSAKLNVPDAGLIRAHVRVPKVTKDELDKTACFWLRAVSSPTTSDIATGPVDCCA